MSDVATTTQYIRVTDIGVEFDPNIPEEEFGAFLSEMIEISKFSGRLLPIYVGDALNFGEFKWGETYTQWCNATGMRVEVLRQWKWTMSRFPMHIRRPNLTYAHYRSLASLPNTEDRAAWCEAASQGEWSRDELECVLRYAKDHGLTRPPENAERIILEGYNPKKRPSLREIAKMVLAVRQAFEADDRETLAATIQALCDCLQNFFPKS
jgi:hypothetical protein